MTSSVESEAELEFPVAAASFPSSCHVNIRPTLLEPHFYSIQHCGSFFYPCIVRCLIYLYHTHNAVQAIVSNMATF